MAGRERGPEPAGAGRPAQGLTLTGQGIKCENRMQSGRLYRKSRSLSRLRMRRGGREFFWIGKFHREIHFPPNASSCRGEHRPPMYKSRKDPSAAVKMDFPENLVNVKKNLDKEGNISHWKMAQKCRIGGMGQCGRKSVSRQCRDVARQQTSVKGHKNFSGCMPGKFFVFAALTLDPG